MPKTHPRYTKAVSAAVTPELYTRILREAEQQGLKVSAVVRGALEEFYDIQPPSIFTIMASEEEATKLRGLGFRIAEQE